MMHCRMSRERPTICWAARPACSNAASKLNAEALRNLLDFPESRIEIVPTCIRFGLSQTLHGLRRFDVNRSSSQIAESCNARAKSILEEIRRFSGLVLLKHLERSCVRR